MREVGASDWLIRTTLASGAAKRPDYASYTVLPWDLVYLVSFIDQANHGDGLRVSAGCDIGYAEKEGRIRTQPWSGCPAGIWSAGIEWNGNVKGCLCLPDDFIEGNVRKQGIADIWRNPQGFSYNRAFDPDAMTGPCRTCPHAFSCACGCIGAALASTGTRYDNLYCVQRVAQEDVNA